MVLVSTRTPETHLPIQPLCEKMLPQSPLNVSSPPCFGVLAQCTSVSGSPRSSAPSLTSPSGTCAGLLGLGVEGVRLCVPFRQRDDRRLRHAATRRGASSLNRPRRKTPPESPGAWTNAGERCSSSTSWQLEASSFLISCRNNRSWLQRWPSFRRSTS